MDDLTDLPQALAGVKGRWLTGASAVEAAPTAWRDLIGASDDAELRLLALTGHALETAFAPAPDGELTAAPPLPELSLPCAPPTARTRFRRVLANLKPDAEQTGRILALAAARGWAVHPADWLPSKTDADAPALYAPWIDWANDQAADRAQALSAETWDDWTPALRRAEMTQLRAREPAAARDVLAAKAGSAPAEERLRLVALLSDGLSKDDAPFLQTLLKDRSSKVQNLAKRLLARLGDSGDAVGDAAQEAAADLAKLCDVGRAFKPLPRRVVKIKSVQAARHSKVFQKFQTTSMAALAQTLGLSPLELATDWELKGDSQIRAAFIDMAAATASADVLAALTARLINEKIPDQATDDFAQALTSGQRADLAAAAISFSADEFAAALKLAGTDLGALEYGVLRGSASWSALLARLDDEVKNQNDSARWRRDQQIAQALFNIGLLADCAAAAALIDALIKRGIIAADPRLDMLYLNTALRTQC